MSTAAESIVRQASTDPPPELRLDRGSAGEGPARNDGSRVDRSLARQQSSSVALLFREGLLLARQGNNEAAAKAWHALLRIEPDHAGALNSLGDLCFATGNLAAARQMYTEAVAKHPDSAASRVNLANLLIKQRQFLNARIQLESALRIDSGYRPAHAGLSFVLAELGEPERAAHHRRIAFENRCFVPAPYRGQRPPIPILELLSTSGGNVRMRAFLSDRIFSKYLVAAQFFHPRMTLPPHRLVVNSIGDAEVGGDALRGAQMLVDCTEAPVINAPAAVLRTTREEVARRLSGVAGVIAPRITRFARAALAPPDAAEALARAGYAFPLLLRTPGFHGGEHFARVDGALELTAALNELPGADLEVIEYLDARRADGKSRKYRVMMIDGQLYPLHAAVSRHWKIHYFSADMADCPENRTEEAAFLENMTEALGRGAIAALTEIQKILGLDYGGVDFGLDGSGNILLFEANATMAILPPARDDRWNYRRPAFERACLAVHGMLMSRAGCLS